MSEFKESPYWRREAARAKRNCKGKPGTARERLLCAVEEALAQLEEGGVKLLRLPRDGGEVFVSANPCSPAAQGLNADLNAAANIGLRALLDPDWEGRWWYVPCDPTTGRPRKDKVKGSAVIDCETALRTSANDDEVSAATKKQGRGKRSSIAGEYVNLWRDVSASPISPEHGPWEPYAAYRAKVEKRIVDRLRLRLGL